MFEWLPEARCCVARCVQCVWLSIWHVSSEQQWEQWREQEAKRVWRECKWNGLQYLTHRHSDDKCRCANLVQTFDIDISITNTYRTACVCCLAPLNCQSICVRVCIFFHTSNAAYQGTPTIYYSVCTSRLNSNLLGVFLWCWNLEYALRLHSNTKNKNKTIDKCKRLTLTIRLDTETQTYGSLFCLLQPWIIRKVRRDNFYRAIELWPIQLSKGASFMLHCSSST